MTTTSTSTPEPLLDLQGLLAGIRWRRRMWMSIGLLGLLAGALLALLAPPPPTATAAILIVREDIGSDGSGQMETDVALFETTRIAAAALQRIDAADRPERFLKSYEGEALTSDVLELTVSGSSDRDAVVRARALADTFIADHIQRAEAAATAEAQALLDRRAEAESELAEVEDSIAGGTADPEPADTRRAELAAQIQQLGQQAEVTGTGAPRVAAGTQLVESPRAVTESLLATGVMNAAVGIVLGLGAGLGLAAVASVVADRPVLRRDIATHLGASIIAQLPAPRRGPARLWRRSRAVAERERVAATLTRAVREDPAAVSLLELGCPQTVTALALDVADQLAADHPVVIIDDLRDRQLRTLATKAAKPIRILDADESQVEPARPEHERRLGVGSVGPGAAWTDLGRLGSETLLVVCAGHADTAWLHTVARQLADARISVIGVVLVHPDPRDRSDGTLWDGLHHALRGRAMHRVDPAPEAAPEPVAPEPVAPATVAPEAVASSRQQRRVPAANATASHEAPVTALRPTGAPLSIPERRFGPERARRASRRDERRTDTPSGTQSTAGPQDTVEVS